jgi:hypothetical protein
LIGSFKVGFTSEASFRYKINWILISGTIFEIKSSLNL